MVRYLFRTTAVLAGVLIWPAAADSQYPGGRERARSFEPYERPHVYRSDDAVDRRAEREVRRLQGSWTLMRYEHNGVVNEPEHGRIILVFEGNRWRQYHDGALGAGGTFRVREIGPDAAHVDLSATQGPGRGIFRRALIRVDGDILQYTYSAEDGARPRRLGIPPPWGGHAVYERMHD